MIKLIKNILHGQSYHIIKQSESLKRAIQQCSKTIPRKYDPAPTGKRWLYAMDLNLIIILDIQCTSYLV